MRHLAQPPNTTHASRIDNLVVGTAKYHNKMRTVKVTQDVPANALALDPYDTQVVIAGRHVFKIFALEEDGLVERANLRAGKHLNLNFSCNDVVWNPLEGENMYFLDMFGGWGVYIVEIIYY
ncbi:WD repeat-containing protein 24 [Portunus trituberculatus]|uniref:WD repeat-containing protein 24 n=1 Tax=Portunus trituberculatus TaxID=210409 RepID=A0A5B7H324_PORTR|nr:WD repeat-containing protein 24 [Portunus trituberculatus]